MKYKLLTAIVSLAMVISMAPGIGATDGNQEPIAMDTPEGIEYLEADQEGPWICEAPSTLDAILTNPQNAYPATCENGEYERSGFAVAHGFSDVPYAEEGWTGTFQSWLIHDGDDRGFECTFDSGELVACQGLGGAFPAQGADFEHVCYAQESETGLEIATHEWGCSLDGELTEL